MSSGIVFITMRFLHGDYYAHTIQGKVLLHGLSPLHTKDNVQRYYTCAGVDIYSHILLDCPWPGQVDAARGPLLSYCWSPW